MPDRNKEKETDIAFEEAKSLVVPTTEQRWVMWLALTTLSWAMIGSIFVVLCWILLKIVKLLYPVLLPLGVAAILAFILDPALVWFEKRGFSRWVSMVLLLLLIIAATVGFTLLVFIPLVEEAVRFVSEFPANMEKFRDWLGSFMQRHPEVKVWFSDNMNTILNESSRRAGDVSQYLLKPFQQIFSWVGYLLGFLFIPIYVFYFLIEKEGIIRDWKEYLPLTKSWVRDELAVVISEINYYLVTFFRGQVVVGAIIGVLTMIGLSLIGLPYAILIGFFAGALSLVPYLGVISTLIPALIIGYTSGSTLFEVPYWAMPLLVAGVFALVQSFEGFFITPKIMGDRTGLHPVTVIISILIWTILLPGLLGPLLAVPLTATIRVLMYRYVWLKTLPEEIAQKRLKEIRQREEKRVGSKS